MGLPKVGKTQTEKEGVGIVTMLVQRPQARGGLGFIYRNQPEADAGIDGHIEIIDATQGEYTGKLVGVQIKTGPSWFRRRTGDGWTVYIERTTVEYWRQYAVPVILAVVDVDQSAVFWALGSAGEFPSTPKFYKIPVPTSQRLDASGSHAIAALARQAPAELLERLRALASEMSVTVSEDLERHRAAWREGRRAEARAWLAARARAPEQLAAIDGPIAAAVLRFAASTTLDEDGDVEAALQWMAEARRRDPEGDDVRLQAALQARAGDLEAALGVLAAAASPSAQIMRASILCAMGNATAARTVLDTTTPVTDVDVADTWRLRARLGVLEGDWDRAHSAAAAAEATAPQHAQVRMLRAALTFLDAIVPDGRPRNLSEWPFPNRREHVRGDAEAVQAFGAAADAFGQLLDLDWSRSERRRLEAWRLAALCALPAKRPEAEAFAREVLARDTAHPYVLFWSVFEELIEDAGPHLDALAAELDQTCDVGSALVYLGACFGANRGEGATEWLEAWRERFESNGAADEWKFWRARAYVASGDIASARALLPDLNAEGARILELQLVEAEVERTGNRAALTAYLEKTAEDTGDLHFLLEACREHARVGQWDTVASHMEALLGRLPTAPVRRLAIHAWYHTRDFARCGTLLDEALARPTDGDDLLEFRRMRADVRIRTGNAPGAVEDMQAVVAVSGSQLATSDLLALARALFLVGRTHELAACARQAVSRPDLGADDALVLAEVLVHDDRHLAVELWQLANTRGVSDVRVPDALMLGYRLGLDAQVGPLHMRMVALAAAGAANVTPVTLDELFDQQRDWLVQRDRVLDLYERGETATHMLAQFLNLPLLHFYHVLPRTTENQLTLRHRFALQLRHGGRDVPSTTAELAAPGRLAMDLSALLLADHLKILPDVEEQFAPVQLSPHILIALREQRDRLKPHQPSRLDVAHRLLLAEREGKIQTWDGELPTLDAEMNAAAAHSWRWVAILERADREGAFVLDLPLREEAPYGRPVEVAGISRLRRLITLDELRRFLVSSGALAPNDPLAASRREGEPDDEIGEADAVGGADFEAGAQLYSVEGMGANVDGLDQSTRDGEGATAQSVRTPARSEGRAAPRLALRPGSVVYLTDSGAEALASSGLLDAAANVLLVQVDPADQAERRAEFEAAPEAEKYVAWAENLMRRISDGLATGRYAMLPTKPTDNADEEEAQVAELRDDLARQRDGVQSGDTRRGASADGESTPAASTAQKGGRQVPFTLRCLTEVVSSETGSLDAVWIDDRSINRHAFAGAARLVDVLEMVAALAASGRISIQRRWTIHHQLRAANVRVLPMMAEEIVYHLQAATVTDGAIVESPPLRVLRQYTAALLEDARALSVPTPQQLAAGQVGELEVLRAYSAAVRDALISLWRATRGQVGASARARVEAQSEWLKSNLYLDLGLLRAHFIAAHQPPVPTPSSALDGTASEVQVAAAGPDEGLSALDATALLTNAAQLLSGGEGLDGPSDDLASEYAQWVYNAVLAQRVSNDARFRSALLSQLRAFFMAWPNLHARPGKRRALAQLLAGWTFDALPQPMRDALSSDTVLMRRLGREVTTSLTVGRWHIASETFSTAAAELLSDPSSTRTKRELPIPALGSDPAVTLNITRTGPTSFALATPDGSEIFHLRDPIFGILAPSKAKRRAARDAILPNVDMAVGAWRRVTQHLVELKDPAGRLEALVTYRERTLHVRYTAMTERWYEESRIAVEDLCASATDVLLDHLRINPEEAAAAFRAAATDVTTPHEMGGDARETDSSGAHRIEGLFRPVWERAAETLLTEEGVEVAFERLSSLPVPLPGVLELTLDALSSDQRRTLVHRLLATPTSPVGAAHVLRVVARFGTTEPAFRRLAWRLARRAACPEFTADIGLLRRVATEAFDSVRSGLSRRPESCMEGLSSTVQTARPVALGPHRGHDDSRMSYSPAAGRLGAEVPADPEVATPENLQTAESDNGGDAGDDRTRSETGRVLRGAGPWRDAVALIASWHHAHRFVTAVRQVGGDRAPLVDWLERRASASIGGLFVPTDEVLRDVADPQLLRPARFVAGALQYASADTSIFRGSDRLFDALASVFTSESATLRAPHADLLRDLGANPDSLGTWLRPTREDDGSIVVVGSAVVSDQMAPALLQAHALARLEREGSDPESWLLLSLMTGMEPLLGEDATLFDRATSRLDVPELLRSLGDLAGLAAWRLARQAWGQERVARRAWLRGALLAYAAERSPAEPTAGAAGQGRAPSGRGDELMEAGLTRRQSAAVEALYVLAQAEASPVAAMRAFTQDLATLSRSDVAYLRSVRGVLERLVLARPLREAQTCLPLLAEARGV